MFGATVDRAGRMIGIDEVELVTADEVNTPIEPSQHSVEPMSQGLPPTTFRTRFDIVDEQGHQCIQVTRVESHRVATRQLADRLSGLDPIESSR